LLLEGDPVAAEGDVVIGGEQGDQAENEATQGLGDAKTVESEVKGEGASKLRLEAHR
jgi:hypothetical protein